MSILFGPLSMGSPAIVATCSGTWPAFTGFSTTYALPVVFGEWPPFIQLQQGMPCVSVNRLGPFLSRSWMTLNDVSFGEMPDLLGYAASISLPAYNIAYGSWPSFTGTSQQQFTCTVNAAFPALLSLSTTYTLPVCFGTMSPFTGISYPFVPMQNPFFLTQYPGFFELVGAHVNEDLFDYGLISQLLIADHAVSITEIAIATAQFSTSLNSILVLSDLTMAEDALEAIFYLVLAANAVAEDSPQAYLSLLLSASDLAQVSDTALTSLQANVLVASLAIVTDSSIGIPIQVLADSAVARGIVSAPLDALVALLETTLTVEDTIGASLSISMILDEDFTVEDTLATNLAAMSSILDVAVVYGHLKLAGVDYSVYAMNVENTAISEYTNFQFNSFCTIDGQAYAAGDAGIYLLEGTTDEGVAIDASIRTGLSTLDTALYKNIPYVYIGTTTDGQLLMKVITTDLGVKTENWYAVNSVDYGSESNNRIRMGKGLKSVYFGFELDNIQGAQFNIDFIKVWRLVLSRRYR